MPIIHPPAKKLALPLSIYSGGTGADSRLGALRTLGVVGRVANNVDSSVAGSTDYQSGEVSIELPNGVWKIDANLQFQYGTTGGAKTRIVVEGSAEFLSGRIWKVNPDGFMEGVGRERTTGPGEIVMNEAGDRAWVGFVYVYNVWGSASIAVQFAQVVEDPEPTLMKRGSEISALRLDVEPA